MSWSDATHNVEIQAYNDETKHWHTLYFMMGSGAQLEREKNKAEAFVKTLKKATDEQLAETYPGLEEREDFRVLVTERKPDPQSRPRKMKKKGKKGAKNRSR